MIAINIIFLLIAALVIYLVLVVPVYHFATRPVRARRDLLGIVLAAIFTLVFLQILWSIHNDLTHWLG